MESCKCKNCGTTQKIKEENIILMPFPHIECQICGAWIALF